MKMEGIIIDSPIEPRVRWEIKFGSYLANLRVYLFASKQMLMTFALNIR